MIGGGRLCEAPARVVAWWLGQVGEDLMGLAVEGVKGEGGE